MSAARRERRCRRRSRYSTVSLGTSGQQIPGVKNTLVLAGFGRGSGANNGFVNVGLGAGFATREIAG